MKMEKIERIKEIFISLYNNDTDCSLCADLFIAWNVDKDFKTDMAMILKDSPKIG